MRKRILSLMLAAVMLVSSMPIGAMAVQSVEPEAHASVQTEPEKRPSMVTYEEPAGPEQHRSAPRVKRYGELEYKPDPSVNYSLYYMVKNDGTVEITGCTYEASGKLILPDEINGKPVTSIGDDAFVGCDGFTGSLIIPDSVTSIGDTAFTRCGGTEFIVSRNNLNYSDYNGILFSKDQKTIIACPTGKTGTLEIPTNVTSISKYAFTACDGLTGNLVIPNSVISIGEAAFVECRGFTGDLTIPDSVTSIGEAAFFGCSGFTGSLTISNNVTSIGDDTFLLCSGFTGSLTIPNSVTSIGNWAFQWCEGFTGNLVIPNSVTSIGEAAFWGCGGTEFIVSKDNPNYSSYNGILFSKDQKTIIACPTGKTGTLEIPTNVTSIKAGAFIACSGITGSIMILSSVTSIGRAAFAYCGGTEFIVSRDNPNYSDYNGILFSKDWKTIIACPTGKTGTLEIPTNVTSISEAAFAGCTGLTGNLVIPTNVTSISEAAFADCTGLTGNLVIPNSVTSIGSWTFQGCSHFTGSLTIPDSVTSIGSWAFQGCSHFTGSLTIPDSVTEIKSNAFGDCSGFTEVHLSSSVEDIYREAFRGCSGLQTVQYEGTEHDRQNIQIDSDNEYLENAKWIYSWKPFHLGQDNNSFIHSSKGSDYGFYGVKNYALEKNTYKKLTKDANFPQKCNLKLKMHEKWDGSCYGIAVSMCLLHQKYLTTSSLTTESKATNYFQLPKPYLDSKFLDNIAFYQLSQYVYKPTYSYIPTSESRDFSGILGNLIDCANQWSSVALSYGDGNSGHTILVCDVIIQQDHSYSLKLYDENSVRKESPQGQFIWMQVSKDLHDFSFTDSNRDVITEKNCTFMEIATPKDLHCNSCMMPLSYSSSLQMMLPMVGSYTLTAADGSTLHYTQGDGFSGTMEYLEMQTINNNTSSYWMVTVPYSDSITLTSTNGTTDMTVCSDEVYLALTGENIREAIFSMEKQKIIVNGAGGAYSFDTAVSTPSSADTQDENLISIAGTATAPVTVAHHESTDEVTAQSEEAITDVTIYNHVENDRGILQDMDSQDQNRISASEVSFPDVNPSDWFYKGVTYSAVKGFMNGMPDGTFGPRATMTRAQLVQMLYAFDGKPTVDQVTDKFSDVTSDDWFADAVTWAVERGVTGGVGGGKFAPNNTITRQEMAVMLYAYMGRPDSAGQLDFADSDEIDTWAAKAVVWAVENGLMSSTSTTQPVFSPKSTATRAEAAYIMMNFDMLSK